MMSRRRGPSSLAETSVVVDTYTRAENLRFEIASALYPPHEITGLAMGSEQLTTDPSIWLRHRFCCYLYYGPFLQRVAT